MSVWFYVSFRDGGGRVDRVRPPGPPFQEEKVSSNSISTGGQQSTYRWRPVEGDEGYECHDDVGEKDPGRKVKFKYYPRGVDGVTFVDLEKVDPTPGNRPYQGQPGHEEEVERGPEADDQNTQNNLSKLGPPRGRLKVAQVRNPCLSPSSWRVVVVRRRGRTPRPFVNDYHRHDDKRRLLLWQWVINNNNIFFNPSELNKN